MAKKRPANPDGPHPFISAYLDRLASELRDVPVPEREEFLAEVRAEFDAGLAGITDPTDKQVMAISARLGQPRALAIQAGLIESAPATKSGDTGWLLSRGAVTCAIIALILTFISAIAAAIVGGVGLVLVVLCLSHWRVLKKTIVLALIMLVATALIVVVQALGGTQAVGQ